MPKKDEAVYTGFVSNDSWQSDYYNCLHRGEFHTTEMVERTKKILLLFLYRFVFLVCHPYSHHR